MLKYTFLYTSMFFLFYTDSVLAEQLDTRTIINVERKDWRDGKYEDSATAIPLVLNINGSISYNRAWLNLSEGMTFIFSENNKTLDNIAMALNGRHVAKKITLSCGAELNVPFCQNYRIFVINFDYDRGEISVIYKNNYGAGSLVENKPLTVINQNIYYSESKYNNNSYRSGSWFANTNTGVTEDLVLGSGVLYDFQRSKMMLDTLTLQHLNSTQNVASLFYSKYSHNGFGRVGGENFRGVNFINESNSADELGNEGVDPIIIDSDYDGIFNVYDQYGNIVSTFTAKRGINRLDIPPGISGQMLKIDIVVEGNVMNTYERANPQERSNAGYDISAGVADIFTPRITKANKKNSSIKNTPFIRYKAGIERYSSEMGAMPEAKMFFASNYLNVIDKVTFSSESIYKDEKFNHFLLLSHSNSWQRFSYFGNYIKKITDKASDSYSAGFSYYLKNNDRMSIYYNGSSGLLSKENRLSVNYNTVFESKNGQFNIGLNTSTKFSSQHNIGINLIFRPNNNSRYFRPSLNMAWQKGTFDTSLANEMKVNENIGITPSIQLNQGGAARYGANLDVNNQYQSTIASVFTEAGGSDITLTSNSTMLLSSKGVQSVNYLANTAYYFENSLKQKNTEKKEINININGVDRMVKNNSIVTSIVGGRGGMADIYSKSESVTLSSTSQQFITKPYRIYTVHYEENEEVILVFGRIINDGQPVNGVSVINHASRTLSDEEGYFSLSVSKQHPVIELVHNSRVCNRENLSAYKNSTGNVFVGRLECRV